MEAVRFLFEFVVAEECEPGDLENMVGSLPKFDEGYKASAKRYEAIVRWNLKLPS